MKVRFESKGGFDNTLKWLNRVSRISPNTVRAIAESGDLRLRTATPEDTGETADGWRHEISVNRNVLEIAWKNIAHPDSDANVAVLVELGHGTGTGGYVAPRPYIKQAMAPVWNKVDVSIKEMMK